MVEGRAFNPQRKVIYSMPNPSNVMERLRYMNGVQQKKEDYSDAPWMELVEGYNSDNSGCPNTGYPQYPIYGYAPQQQNIGQQIYYGYQQPQVSYYNQQYPYGYEYIPQQNIGQQTYYGQQPQVSYSQQEVKEVIEDKVEDDDTDEKIANEKFVDFVDRLNKISGNSDKTVEGLGSPRIGLEEFKKLGFSSNEELISFHLNNILSVDIDEFNRSNIKYGLIDLGNRFYQLDLFLNDSYIDSFLVDSGVLFGKGVPSMQCHLIQSYDQYGMPILFKEPVWIPLGCYLAIRQNIFRKFPSGNNTMNMNGTDITVYSSAMYDLMTKDFYKMIDMSDTLMPDDKDNYKKFGEKVMMINNTTYPLKARYRVYNYKDNDDFCLISDNLVKHLPGNKPFATSTFIQVQGKNLYITEPKRKLNLTIKNRHFK